MRAHLIWIVLASCVVGAWPAGQARADGWVQALSELQPAPAQLSDDTQPLPARIGLARALGTYGPEADAVALLLEALGQRPPPALREEILLSLARRAPQSADAPLALLLASEENLSPALANALAAIGTRTALSALVAALDRPHASVVERALLNVGPASAAPLGVALSTPLALRAAKLLARLGPDAAGAEPALLRALRSPLPRVRIAAADALGALGDEHDAAALQRALADPEPGVIQAVLVALGRVATPAQAGVLADLFAHAEGHLRELALRALVRADAAVALPAVQVAASSPDLRLRAAARDAIESAETPDTRFVPLLQRWLQADLSEVTASALARVARGEGAGVLIATGDRSPDAAQRVSRAVAIALRRFANEVDGDVIERGHTLLHSLPPGDRRLLLCALARDRDAVVYARAALSSSDARRRAIGARALGWLGEGESVSVLRAALAQERDPEAARRMLEAALVLDAPIDRERLYSLMRDAETAPEAMQLAAASAGEAQESLRVLLREALASSAPARVRATAALALARLHDVEATPALASALGDSSPRVRLAVVRALAALGGGAAARALLVHARIERDPLVRRAAREATVHAGVPDALMQNGDRVLEVRLTARGVTPIEPLAEVLLGDGRWLRVRALSGGELIITDLAPGRADVRAID